MRESITKSAILLRDRGQVFFKKIGDIADQIYPWIEDAVKKYANSSVNLRETILKYMQAYQYDTLRDLPVGLRTEREQTLDVDSISMGVISLIPLTVLATLLTAEQQQFIFNSLEESKWIFSGDSYRDSFSQGENKIRLDGISFGYFTTEAILDNDIKVPHIEVGPKVDFRFGNRQQDNGSVFGNQIFIPRPDNISPVGTMAQVDSIKMYVSVDIDTAFKAYWRSIYKEGIYSNGPGEPIGGYGNMTDDDISQSVGKTPDNTDVKRKHFVDSCVGSTMITFFAAVARSLGLYESATSELLNPLMNVLDEGFLEYQDLDEPNYLLTERRTSEPHWLRFNVSKASALIDAVLLGKTSGSSYIGTAPVDPRYTVFSDTLSLSIQAYFYGKYKVENSENVVIDSQTMPIIRLGEKSLTNLVGMLDRKDDPLFSHDMVVLFEEASKYPYKFLWNNADSSMVLQNQNGVKTLQKIMILISYIALVTNAVSTSNSKYQQWNNFFGRKGGYHTLLKRLLFLLKGRLQILNNDAFGKDYNDTCDFFQFKRFNSDSWRDSIGDASGFNQEIQQNSGMKAVDHYKTDIVVLASMILDVADRGSNSNNPNGGSNSNNPNAGGKEGVVNLIRYYDLERTSVMNIPFKYRVISLMHYLSQVYSIISGAVSESYTNKDVAANHGSDRNNSPPGTSVGNSQRRQMELTNQIRPFFGKGEPNRDYSQHRIFSSVTQESFTAVVEHLERAFESGEPIDPEDLMAPSDPNKDVLDTDPVTIYDAADELEDELDSRRQNTYDENDPNAEGNLEDIQALESVLQRFDIVISKFFKRANGKI